MGATKIWNAMEIAEEAREKNGGSSNSEIICSSSLTVDHTLSLPQMTPRIIELCKDLFKNWSELDNTRFSVETVSGGITNLSAGFGAKLLAVFGNGMVQSFITARTLTPLDMRRPKLAAEIAKQLSIFHQVEIPGSKEPQLWNDIFKFFQKASALAFDDGEKQRKYETISFEEVHTEVIELKELTGRLDAPVVFAHNDLLSGNLMLNDEEEKLYLIDFEYGSYNYRGFDIGNHFNEYAGYDCDYSLYPTKDEQYHFLRHYLEPENPEEVSEEDLEALYIETNTYMLASHLYWALWALIQAKMSPIDFDYLSYFFLRYNEYKKQKENCFSLAQSYLSKSRTG
ncbi:probable ethanolamine kinase isoform X2 [Rhododendron vialii]|uniref:probable ethanolamine kinase isoform X2 n=1 Tax=Rhododendron vialii TaxID=182163 RepID=UPI00265FBF7E|nr:probable ethanolamine kinase isoform X2 [Rhododendron vialii]